MISIVYITARKQPHLEWFFESLNNQILVADAEPEIIIVDYLHK